MLLCTEVVSASCRITPVPLRASVVIVVIHLYTAVHGTTEMAHGEGHAVAGADEKMVSLRSACG